MNNNLDIASVAKATHRAILVGAAADRLRAAAVTGVACDPVRDLLGVVDVDLAYDVQQILVLERLANGARIVGRKIGLTSEAVQRQLGVDRPDYGVLFQDMAVADDAEVAFGSFLQPKAEAEIAFVLNADLDATVVDGVSVRSAVDYGVAAIEIVDSRVRGWDISITDTVADNASSGMFVLGARRVAMADFEPADVTMSMTRNGAVVSEGNGRACLGDPLKALAWLARTARDYGAPLRAGDIVLSGALGPMVAAESGSRFVANISILGRVSLHFSG